MVLDIFGILHFGSQSCSPNETFSFHEQAINEPCNFLVVVVRTWKLEAKGILVKSCPLHQLNDEKDGILSLRSWYAVWCCESKVTPKRWDEWHLCWHEDAELHHGNPAQFDLIKLRSEFSRLCWRLVTIRSRLLQRWNDKLDNTCQVSFVVLGERYCDLYKGRSKVEFVYLFSRMG